MTNVLWMFLAWLSFSVATFLQVGAFLQTDYAGVLSWQLGVFAWAAVALSSLKPINRKEIEKAEMDAFFLREKLWEKWDKEIAGE